jgi:hypothetical protein
LGIAMSLEDGNELGRQGYGLAAPFFDLPEDQTAALAVGAGCRVPGAARRADPGIVGGDAGVPPAGFAEGFGAGSAVPAFGAGRYVRAAMPPGQALQLEPDAQFTGVQVDVVPAQSERFALPEPARQPN